MEGLGSRVIVRAALTLAILCGMCMFMVDPGSAEFYLMTICVIINCIVSIVGHVINCRREKE